MQVSIETVKGLERKMTISVPAEKVEHEMSLRLTNLARKAKIDGFRPGKAPLSLIKRRFTTSALHEVTEQLAKDNFEGAINTHQLKLAAPATFSPEQIELGKDYICSFTFEILPEINLIDLNDQEIELIRSEVSLADIDAMLEKLREQHKDWEEVSRPVKSGDKITIDAQGYIDDKPFEGGKLDNFEFVMGENKMLPDFEKGLVGQEKGMQFAFNMIFPEDYHAELAGKNAQFKGTVSKIMEGQLPSLNDAFVEKFNIKEGGLEALKKDLEEHMRRELDLKVSARNRQKIFDALLAVNPIEIPNVLLDKEIEHLKHEMYHQLFGHQHSDDEVIPDFPRELFVDRAKTRVELALIIPKYIQIHNIVPDKKRIKDKIELLAGAYDDAQEFYDLMEHGENEKTYVENLVVEEMVADKITEHAKVIEKYLDYHTVMNPKKEEDEVKSNKNSKKVKEAKLEGE